VDFQGDALGFLLHCPDILNVFISSEFFKKNILPGS
jgi:hypothetical protein